MWIIGRPADVPNNLVQLSSFIVKLSKSLEDSMTCFEIRVENNWKEFSNCNSSLFAMRNFLRIFREQFSSSLRALSGLLFTESILGLLETPNVIRFGRICGMGLRGDASDNERRGHALMVWVN